MKRRPRKKSEVFSCWQYNFTLLPDCCDGRFCPTLWTIPASNAGSYTDSGSSSHINTLEICLNRWTANIQQSINPSCPEGLHKCDGRSRWKIFFGHFTRSLRELNKMRFGFNCGIQVSQSRLNFFSFFFGLKMWCVWHDMYDLVLKGRDRVHGQYVNI